MSRWCVFPRTSVLFSYVLIQITRLLNYTPPAVVIRLLTTNGLIAYITSWVLYLSGASYDPRLLLPAWISITTVRPAPISLSLSISYRKAQILIQYPDLNLRLPRHPKPRHHQTRNRSLAPCCVRRQFRQHVLSPSAITSDSRERARGSCFCYHSQIMGLGRGYFPAHASR